MCALDAHPILSRKKNKVKKPFNTYFVVCLYVLI